MAANTSAAYLPTYEFTNKQEQTVPTSEYLVTAGLVGQTYEVNV